MHREELRAYLDRMLDAGRFRDYCPNGLQVEGREEVRRVVCGVTASQALLEAAIDKQADAILVHHGWFWKNDDLRLTGFRRRRMATLLRADMNLFAYHLPLDAHAELGNNAELARRAGWSVEARFGDQDIGFVGSPAPATTAAALARVLEDVLQRAVLVVGDLARPVKRVAWCSGGAQGMFELAIAMGADCYVSGEISEPTVHLARETGVVYIAAGHHATERFGVMALGAHLQSQCGIECEFVDIDNPV